MPFKELDEQIEKIRQREEDLSGNRKELCRRSFMIQSEEIKNDIKELRKKLVNKKEEIKEKEKDIKKEVNKLEKDLNGLVLSDSKLYKKSYLENLYFISTIVLGSIPIMSLLGFVLLYFYLKDINASIYFLEIASDGGIWFSVVVIIFIFISQWMFPWLILGLQESGSDKYGDTSNLFEKIWNFLVDKFATVFLYLFSFSFSLLGFIAFFGESWLLFPASLLWNLIIFSLSKIYNKSTQINQINSKICFILIPFIWIILFSVINWLLSSFDPAKSFKLTNVFKIIEFNQQNDSWFRVNKSYFDRTGLTVSDIKIKEKEFTDDKTATYSFSSDGKSVFLYGKLWVNSKNVKILCPPVFEEDKSGQLIIDKGKPKISDKNPDGQISDKNPDGRKKCIRFQSEDLQDISGLTELLRKGQ